MTYVEGGPATGRYVVTGWGSASWPGPEKVNQDRCGQDGTVFSLADGMGGMALGDLAASVAVSSLHDAIPRTAAGLEQAMFTANNAVRALGQVRAASVGTTLVAAVISGTGGWVASVGDSRAWCACDGGSMQLLTVDHTAAAEAGVELGDPRYPELSRHLTQYLGRTALVETTAVALPVPERIMRVVLTSDGIHDLMTPEAISTAAEDRDPASAAAILVADAIGRGGHDDATAVVVDVAHVEGGT